MSDEQISELVAETLAAVGLKVHKLPMLLFVHLILHPSRHSL